MDRYGILIAYNTWANRRTTDQIKSLTVEEYNKELGGSFPSLRLTLTHLLISDWLWLNRWQGKPIVLVPINWDTTSAEALEVHWDSIQREIKLFIEALITDR